MMAHAETGDPDDLTGGIDKEPSQLFLDRKIVGVGEKIAHEFGVSVHAERSHAVALLPASPTEGELQLIAIEGLVERSIEKGMRGESLARRGRYLSVERISFANVMLLDVKRMDAGSVPHLVAVAIDGMTDGMHGNVLFHRLLRELSTLL